MRKLIICRECREEKPHSAFGLCQNCYKKQNIKICKSCGRLIKTHALGLCAACYQHKRGITSPMSEKKLCGLYLGVFINEQLLLKIFKDVKEMPPNNPGYDFVCSKNKKVDAKSSVIKITKCETKYWFFTINKNEIADYFFCVAYDNRKDLNVMHMWLIPGKDVNNRKGISISESKLHKWSQYEQPIDKALLCCNEMKGR